MKLALIVLGLLLHSTPQAALAAFLPSTTRYKPRTPAAPPSRWRPCTRSSLCTFLIVRLTAPLRHHRRATDRATVRHLDLGGLYRTLTEQS